MNHQLKRLTSKRVADFFVSVNAGEDLTVTKDLQTPVEFTQWTFNSSVMERYPVTDRPNQPLPEGLPIFCFPNGVELSKSNKPPSFHTFVHTSEGGARMLGCCLTFYEKLSNSQIDSLNNLIETNQLMKPDNINLKEYYIPYCICLISHFAFVSSFRKFICHLYKASQTACIIPIERYICNFIDDVPAPPAGRIDVTYYLNDQAISFRCPASNEPNVWSGMPLFPLFECLSPENILQLFGLIVTERQILFISSQYSLLTIAAEAMTSLLYPLTWSHAYIPILPRMLLGFVAAPFPFIAGVHTSYYSQIDHSVCDEICKVFLDSNRIEYGSLGPAPPLPDRRARKLGQEIIAAGRLFECRTLTWLDTRLPYFDDAFSSVSEKPASPWMKAEKCDEELRSAFLKFFVSILKNYRRHLIYGKVIDKFNFDSYIQEYPVDWQPFLQEMVKTQQFSEFIDSRIFEVGRDPDVVFFDESIDAKMNRYTFKLHGHIDTPFLNNTDTKHTKTYVAPSPDKDNLSHIDGPYVYTHHLAKLNPSLFSSPRNLTPPLNSGNSSSTLHLARLKRNTTAFSTAAGPINPLSSASCIYSAYLVTLSRLICYTQSHMVEFRVASRPTIQQIIEEFGYGADDQDGTSTIYNSEKVIDLGRLDIRLIENSLVEKQRESMYDSPTNHQSTVSNTNSSRFLKGITPVSPAAVSLENHESKDRSSPPKSIYLLSFPPNGYSPDKNNNNTTTTSNMVPINEDIMNSADEEDNSISPPVASNSPREKSHEVTFSLTTSPRSIRTRSRPPSALSRWRSDASIQIQDKDVEESSKLAMRVAIEALNCLSRADENADDAIYRSMAEALGNCGFAQEIIDLIVHMGDEGLLPDNQMLSSVARAISIYSGNDSSNNGNGTNNSNNNSIGDMVNTSSKASRNESGSSINGNTVNTPSTNNNNNTNFNQYCPSPTPSIQKNNDVLKLTKAPDLQITPSDVWVLQDWQWNQIAKNSFYRRKLFASSDISVHGNTAQHRLSTREVLIKESSAVDSWTDWLLGGSSTVTPHTQPTVSSSSTLNRSKSNEDASFNHNNNNNITTNNTTTTTTTVNGHPTKRLSVSQSQPQLARSQSMRSGSSSKSPSALPNLNWAWKIGDKIDPTTIYSASKKLSRQMAVAEELLISLFPGLHIDLQHPLGMTCPGKPGKPCPLGRPLTIDEIYNGWDIGNSNKYTTLCYECNCEFVPRFTVECKSKNWIGTEGPKTPFWCELLSPWTLRKELFTVLFDEGIEHVISPSFRHPSISQQHAVLFWNIIIVFRLYGLPYSFLLCGQSITTAFPPLKK